MFCFLNFCSTFLFLLPLVDTETTYQSCIQVWRQIFLLGEAEEMVFNRNWEHVYRAFLFANLKTYSLGLQVHEQAEQVLNTSWTLVSASERQWVSGNSPWTPIECAWMPMSVGTAPEHPLSVHEDQWVRGKNPWTPIECSWMPLSKYLKGLNEHL